jgi:hypothetical protein
MMEIDDDDFVITMTRRIYLRTEKLIMMPVKHM